MVKVSGRDVVSTIFVDPAPQIISKGPNEGQTYYRARHDGKGFTVTQTFYDDWKSGKIVEVSLSPSKYFVDDPMNPEGAKIERESWQLSAYANIDQFANVELNEQRLNKIRAQGIIENKIIQHDAMKKLNLDEATMKALLASV